MTPEDAIRFLAHEALRCREVLRQPDLTVQAARDALEMYALLHPPLVRVLDLQPMDHVEAAAFHCEFHQALRERQRVMTGADFPN